MGGARQSGKRAAKSAEAVPQSAAPPSQKAAAADPAPGSGWKALVKGDSRVVDILDRPMDIVHSLLYVALTAFAVLPLLSPGCSSVVPADISGDICPLASTPPRAGKTKGYPLLAGLWHQWHSGGVNAGAAGEVALFLLRADIAANLILGPCLALVMLTGASRNSWQVPAIAHLSITGVANAALAAGAAAPQGVAGRISRVFFTMIPLLLLRRWWCEWPFSVMTLKGSRSIVWRLYNAIFTLCVLAWVLYSAASVYDWAVSSHQDLSHLPKTGPTLDHAATLTQEYAGEGFRVGQQWAEEAAAVASDVGKKTFASVSSSLADLGDKLKDAMASAGK
eukprot:TRINITY_DN46981_c0_g1_i1.p1 TRINITY_DN46981_c0_g1~~TRINITY_DN46981_c0_g1_i1.p1  ORF type:complete len:336 (+),score=98.69 TRINITY_DN46981_c0_g1_i1:75-1082(+)